MKLPSDYDTNTATKAIFRLVLDTNTWESVQYRAPSIDLTFMIFPDIEVIELDFIRPNETSPIAYLSSIPKAWIRLGGKLTKFDPTQDIHGVSAYLFEIGEQLSPLPLSALPGADYEALGQQRFSMTLTPSACLLTDPLIAEHAAECPDLPFPSGPVVTEGFTSRQNPGGSKFQRLNAQMSSVCEAMSLQTGHDICFEKIIGTGPNT